MTKTMSWAASQSHRPWNVAFLYLVAAGLNAATRVVTRVAERVAAAEEARAMPLGTVEFHAVHREAGAPEGAIYVDGKLYAIVPGVNRL